MKIRDKKVLVPVIVSCLLFNLSYSQGLMIKISKLKHYMPEFLSFRKKEKKWIVNWKKVNFKNVKLKNLKPSRKQALIGLGVAACAALLYRSGKKIVDATTNFRRKLIHKVCRRGNLLALKILLMFNKKEYINAELNKDSSYSKYTALELACERGHANIVRFLAYNGVDINKKGSRDGGSLGLACDNWCGKEDKVLDMVESLVENGADVNMKTGWRGRTPLYIACEKGHKNVAKYLVKHGADINIKSGYKDETPLHAVCERGHEDIVLHLVKHGAAINAVDDNENTPLHYAAKRWNIEVVRHLICKGASLNAINEDQETALSLGNINVVRAMAQIGGIGLSEENVTKTIDKAFNEKNTAIVSCLLRERGRFLSRSSLRAWTLRSNKEMDKLVGPLFRKLRGAKGLRKKASLRKSISDVKHRYNEIIIQLEELS